MRPLLRTALSLAGLLLATSPLCAQMSALNTNSYIIVPDSSIEQPDDIGVRAHTNFLVIDPNSGFRPFGGLGPNGGMTPAQMRSFYNLPSTGGSQIIAIVDAYDNPYALTDFNTFSTQFGLPTETSSNALSSSNQHFQVVYASGSKPTGNTGWGMEEALDIEWAHAMAPSAKIVLVEANSNSYADLFTAVSKATSFTDSNGLATKEVSMSWGGSEFSGENTYDSYFASTSVVYFASAGDYGAPAQYPSASPDLISAGGTTVKTDNSGNFLSETAWSSGGGGPSSQEGIPSYQNGITSIVGSSRGTPDLSYDADPSTGASIYDQDNGGWIVVGGTSWSSPALAGVLNLADTATGSFAAGSQAELAILYSNLGSSNFRDITSGNNGYPAGTGWDFTTGVGSVQGLNGLTSASAPAPTLTKIAPGSVLAGGPSFTVTATGTNFASNSVIQWNGASLTTTYVSGTSLKATVPSGDITKAGSAKITVSTPGGGTSGYKTLSIKETSLLFSLTSLVKNSNGTFTANISLKNTGYLAANSLTISASTLGAAATSTTLPMSLGNLAAGSSVSATLNYSSTAGTSGTTVTLKVVSKFTSGNSTNTLKVKLP